MAPAGLAAVARARRDGSWSFHDDIDRLRCPGDLKRGPGPIAIMPIIATLL